MLKVQASNVNYELHTLGWKAFQNLCSTIVSEIWGQTVQTFFDSHDGGRDGAFQGSWENKSSELFTGSFTVQCKFTAKVDEQIKLSDLKDELKKAERLASKGLSDNYFLFSNARLTGTNEEIIREKFQSINGINNFKAYGVEWISQKILESSRLRMLVPRVYGLGDLSQIMDERSYEQAIEILGSLGDDLSKFVITNAFRNSSNALKEHGFVLLLGEPACGKSTIAAALAVGALDTWSASTIKLCSPEEFTKHWNPKEPRQLFWVDDAFGATQVDWAKTLQWNYFFPHLQAALSKGAKVIFTSRDYIYKKARESLKETALPLLKESQVVINVQDITTNEREQILYNHIKLGNQSKYYKRDIKSFLNSVVENKKFSPETARRLGNPLFTKSLHLTASGIKDYVEHPMDFLIEVIRTLDVHSRAALALIFMKGGSLLSPIEISSNEEKAICLLGSNISSVRSAFSPLDGSLLLRNIEHGVYSWRYKHPTIRDAFAVLVADDSELMDIYLTGSPMDKIFNEVTCGYLRIEGAKVVVPDNRFSLVVERVKSLDLNVWYHDLALIRFLSYRCNKAFLELFLCEFPDYLDKLKIRSYFSSCSTIDLLVRLNDEQLLPENSRLNAVLKIQHLAISTPDSGFRSERVRRIINDREYQTILESVRSELIGNLECVVDDWRGNFDNENDPEEYFDELKHSLEGYRFEFEDDSEALAYIDSALEDIDESVVSLRSENWPDQDSKGLFERNIPKDEFLDLGRSIFDDIDE